MNSCQIRQVWCKLTTNQNWMRAKFKPGQGSGTADNFFPRLSPAVVYVIPFCSSSPVQYLWIRSCQVSCCCRGCVYLSALTRALVRFALHRCFIYLDETWVNAGHTKEYIWQDTTVKPSQDAFLKSLTTGLAVPTSPFDPCTCWEQHWLPLWDGWQMLWEVVHRQAFAKHSDQKRYCHGQCTLPQCSSWKSTYRVDAQSWYSALAHKEKCSMVTGHGEGWAAGTCSRGQLTQVTKGSHQRDTGFCTGSRRGAHLALHTDCS